MASSAADLALPRGERHLRKINNLANNLGTQSTIDNQRVSEPNPKPQFDLLDHAVYDGRQRLGGYSRIAPTRYAAYDANGHSLGEFSHRQDAYLAVAALAEGSAQ
jgi:hypothetical protein